MVNFLIIGIVVLLVIFLLLKWNNARTKIAFIFIALGVIFLLLTGYLIFSGKEINLTTMAGLSSAIKTSGVWFKNAGSNIAKISSYVFKQDWKGDSVPSDINSTG